MAADASSRPLNALEHLKGVPGAALAFLRAQGIATVEQAWEFVSMLKASPGRSGLPPEVSEDDLKVLQEKIEALLPSPTRSMFAERPAWPEEWRFGVLPPEDVVAHAADEEGERRSGADPSSSAAPLASSLSPGGPDKHDEDPDAQKK